MAAQRNKWYHDKHFLYLEWQRCQFSTTKLAQEHNIPRTTLSHFIHEFNLNKGKVLEECSSEYIEHIIKGGRGVVAGDWHIPITNWPLVYQMFADAKAHKCTDWITIPGDFLNQDATSRHFDKQHDAGLKVERDQATQCIKALRKVFGEIYITKGNHDVRHIIRLQTGLSFIDSLQLFINDETVKTTRCDYVLHESTAGLWRFCHTKQYSRVQLNVPNRIAEKYRCHVIACHRHHSAIGWSNSGYRIIEGGGLFDAAKTQYLREWTTTFPHWQPGYYLMADGLPYAPMLSMSPLHLRRVHA